MFSHSNAHKPPKAVAPTRPQTAQNCGSYSFNARIQIVTEMCCSHQYLSVNTKKSLPRPQTAHKIQNIAGMNANISETIKDRKLDFSNKHVKIIKNNLFNYVADYKVLYSHSSLKYFHF